VEFKHVNNGRSINGSIWSSNRVMIAMAVVTFGLRGKGHPDPELNA